MQSAVADAGLALDQVDGMVTFTMDTNPEIEIARNLGIGELSFFSRIHHGGGAACGTIQQAAMAVTTGVADVVVCYRAFNERSGHRFGSGVQGRPPMPNAENAHYAWYSPHGLLTPAQWVAMFARRYMHEYGATSEDFGRVAVADRKHAATNPEAWFYEQADHARGPPGVALDRRAVAPARLLPGERRRPGARRDEPSSARATSPRPASGDPRCRAGRGARPADDDELLPRVDHRAARDGPRGPPALGHHRPRPDDIQTAIIYDHFTPFVLTQLEEFGFCGRGEAKDFIRDGASSSAAACRSTRNGGQLGEAYIHGMNGIAEGVRQVRGTSVNQVPDVEHVLVTAGTGVPTSGLILGGGGRGGPPGGGRGGARRPQPGCRSRPDYVASMFVRERMKVAAVRGTREGWRLGRRGACHGLRDATRRGVPDEGHAIGREATRWPETRACRDTAGREWMPVGDLSALAPMLVQARTPRC